jgi:hypothetical protein
MNNYPRDSNHKARNELYQEFARITYDIGACDFMSYRFTAAFAEDLRVLADKIDKYVEEVFEKE